MAVVKVYAVRSKLKRAVEYAANEDKTLLDNIIEYAANPNKTEKRLFETAINCSSVETSYKEMVATKKKYGKEGKVLAYHYIQSFKPGEVTPEPAHKIGVEFARECFGDRFEVVIGTHLDRHHIHNHIVVNSVSFVDGGKFRSTPKNYYNEIRKVSDRLCREYGLSVIDDPQHKGMHYAEWKAVNEGKPTIRGQVREELDEIIKASPTMQMFWRELKRRGYTVHRRGENIKYTSIIPPFGKRPVRLDKLGAEYSEEAIRQRIIAQQSGIYITQPSQVRKIYKVRGNIYKAQRKKLKGFQALYFHYLYLFKKIRKRRTPQRVSFFMRDELIKMERYQKQFRFLYDNNIETAEQLEQYQSKQEARINDLVEQRKNLHQERNSEDEQGKEEIAKKVTVINGVLKECRSDVRMCKAIFADAEKLEEKCRQAQALQKEAERVIKHEHKRRSR
ncbi:MAG: relaxase/mobilization nuclease domain-containing protein [Monoglobales bacterium]